MESGVLEGDMQTGRGGAGRGSAGGGGSRTGLGSTAVELLLNVTKNK